MPSNRQRFGSTLSVVGDGAPAVETSQNLVRNIYDLAQLLGVSPSTVSRALSNNPLVNKETRDRVQAAAFDHGFWPNKMASRLRSKKTGVIGIAIPLGHERNQRLSDPFFMTLLGHLADELSERGYDVMLSRIIPDADDWLERLARTGMLDGILMIGQSDQYLNIERVAASYRPLVVWGSHFTGQNHCAIGIDNRLGGQLAGQTLIQRGCRQLAFMGDAQTPEMQERYSGLCDAAASAGLAKPQQIDIQLASETMTNQISKNLDRLGTLIDGVAAASDVIAMHLLRLLADRGTDPKSLPVTGFDDLPLAGQTIPRITTVRQDLVTGAKAMVAALCARIDGHDAPSVQMVPSMVIRDSA